MPQEPTIVMKSSPLIWKSSASAPPIGSVKKVAVYPPAYPSPTIQGVRTDR